MIECGEEAQDDMDTEVDRINLALDLVDAAKDLPEVDMDVDRINLANKDIVGMMEIQDMNVTGCTADGKEKQVLYTNWKLGENQPLSTILSTKPP